MLKKRVGERSCKNSGMLVIIGVLACLATVGFAFLSTSLNISGSATIADNKWDVHFANIREIGGSVTPTTAANVNETNKTSVSFSVTFKQPNEYYKFLIDVENKGTIDAMVKTIDIPTVSDTLKLTATYKDGTEIKANDVLKVNETKTLLVTLKNISEDVIDTATTQDITFTLEYGQADDYAQEIAEEYTVEDFINLSNGVSTADYESGIKSEMYAFSHAETEQLGVNIDYRYIGKSPQNYIKFNNEAWRIIGIFQTNDGKSRLKIIKDESVSNTTMSWDYKKNGVGSSTDDRGSNDWSDSQLMYFLNLDDITANATAKGYTFANNLVKSGSNIIYEKYKLPADIAAGAASYPGAASSWRVSTDALTKVDSVKYYLGGRAYNSTTGYGTGEELYTWERGNKGRNNSTATADLSWAGKVALMYPSDYVYTFAKEIDNTCFTNAYKCNSSRGGVPGNSWLYKSAYTQWTLAPDSGNADGVLYVSLDGHVNHYSAYGEYGVRPVVYLKSDIKLSGSGMSEDPYIIK